jgi:hypothetical protein
MLRRGMDLNSHQCPINKLSPTVENQKIASYLYQCKKILKEINFDEFPAMAAAQIYKS